jgi:dethiobiotin synthetase
LAVAIATHLAERGARVLALKPIETGCRPRLAEVGQDAPPGQACDSSTLTSLARLEELAGPPPASTYAHLTSERLEPRDGLPLSRSSTLALPEGSLHYRFAPRLEPAVAARLAAREIALPSLVASIQAAAAAADFVIVEGHGGLCVPLSPTTLEADLVRELSLPVLLLCPSSPGAISHTLLTIEGLRARSLSLAGVVLNRLLAEPRAEEASYPYQIELFAGEVVRGVLPHFSRAELADPHQLARRLAAHVALEHLLPELPRR